MEAQVRPHMPGLFDRQRHAGYQKALSTYRIPRTTLLAGMALVTQISPRSLARIAGGLYLINIGAGAFSYGFVRSTIVFPGDAARTAANIQQHELLYRSGFVAIILVVLSNVPLALLFYELFRVVQKSFAALVAFFILVATAIETVNMLNYFAPLILLSGDRHLRAFTTEQLQSMSYVLIALQAIGFNVAVVFFAFYDLLIGYLILSATFLPRILGVLMAIAGLCYLINSFANFLSPAFAAHLLPYILIPSGVAEPSFCLWLLVMGVNEARWENQANAARQVPMKAAV